MTALHLPFQKRQLVPWKGIHSTMREMFLGCVELPGGPVCVFGVGRGFADFFLAGDMSWLHMSIKVCNNMNVWMWLWIIWVCSNDSWNLTIHLQSQRFMLGKIEIESNDPQVSRRYLCFTSPFCPWIVAECRRQWICSRLGPGRKNLSWAGSSARISQKIRKHFLKGRWVLGFTHVHLETHEMCFTRMVFSQKFQLSKMMFFLALVFCWPVWFKRFFLPRNHKGFVRTIKAGQTLATSAEVTR